MGMYFILGRKYRRGGWATAYNSKAICNKGFRCNSSILPRSNFSVGRQGSTPQSLTAYSRKPLAVILLTLPQNDKQKQSETVVKK
jgi:hypothetical protein